jgi:glutamyl-tRNA synthetase
MHIGNARVAIVNHLFARQQGGVFLLRIDDTDATRSKKEFEDLIMDDLRWLGIDYDETFRQTERIGRYEEVTNKLIANGVIYKCYESQEELEYKRRMAIARGKAPVYDRAALGLSDEQKRKLDDDGVPSYWRFKLPNKVITWKDLVSGEISYDLGNVSDPVVVKADGTYLYTFSSVIDDHDSEVTHVIRGQDHVTNTSVQIAILDEIANNSKLPQFAHLALLVNKDGSQFSKRLGSSSIQDIREQGIDPMAVSCTMATLGSSLDVVPFLRMPDLIAHFDISKFSANSPKFDIDDIIKLNGKILHMKPYEDVEQYGLSAEEFYAIRENITTYHDLQMWKEIFSPSFVSPHRPSSSDKELLKIATASLASIQDLTQDTCAEFLAYLSRTSGKAGKELYTPLRLSLTGMKHGPNITKLLALLGSATAAKRWSASCSEILDTFEDQCPVGSTEPE